MTAGYMSSGIMRWRMVRLLLDEFHHWVKLRPLRAPRVDAVIGWGLKPSATRAHYLAKRNGLPYIALEDGFIRSLGLGIHGYQPHSLVVDNRGIYYDASRPSDLEALICRADFPKAELQRARIAMDRLRRHRLSKYNHAPDIALPASQRRQVLVVDQTFDDASVAHGQADAQTFHHMLDEAIRDNPGAEILVKLHPDVIAGKKRGYLADQARRLDCQLITHDLNPWALFDAVDEVHVVTSQLGFEALIAGKQVHCHGMPFFAGWGLTRDRQQCSRRGIERSLETVFAAAYLRYSRYANPYTGEHSTLEETIDLIADQKRQRDRLAGPWGAYGFARWKRAFLPDFLGSNARVRFVNSRHLPSPEQSDERWLVWGQKAPDRVIAHCRRHNLPLWRVEDGFIRSVGLGVDLIRPLSLAIDGSGLYYDASARSDLERLLNQTQFDAALVERAYRLRQRLVDVRLTKYNLVDRRRLSFAADLPLDRQILLIPGQVESDASIACGSPVIQRNRDLLETVREQNPDAFILFKPHPDVVSGVRLGALAPEDQALFDREVSGQAMVDLLDVVDEVHTMCSLTGFEALLRGIDVHTYGMPFYAGWGLTQDSLEEPRRQRRLSLDELVAGVLLLYPIYVDPNSGHVCNAETVVSLLEQQCAEGRGPSFKTRLYRGYRSIFTRRH